MVICYSGKFKENYYLRGNLTHMNRALYIIGIVLSVVFIGVCGYYIAEYQQERFSYILSSSYYSSYDYASGNLTAITEEAGLVSLFFFLFFITADIMGLVKVKRKTMKVMGIIGLCISGIFLLWNLAMLAEPGAMSFDEVGGGFVFYALIMLAFSIVGLVQSVQFAKYGRTTTRKSTDLLDS